jgi:hypothetical protein
MGPTKAAKKRFIACDKAEGRATRQISGGPEIQVHEEMKTGNAAVQGLHSLAVHFTRTAQ